MQTRSGTAAALLAATLVLSACGGGDEGFIVEEKDPSPSGRAASMALAGATAADASFNGTYATNDVSLNDVVKVNPIGGPPETCRFKFSNLPQTGNPSVGMSGNVRYFPGSAQLNVVFVSIGSTEFSLEGTTSTVTIDRSNDRVVFTGARLTSTQGTGRSINLTGTIPMRDNRPEGC